MKKHILIAFVCASLILITPFTVVAQENKISSNLTEQPDIEGLVAQLRVVIDEILQKYGHIPMVANLCNMILDLSDLIGKILYCIALIIIFIPFAILFLFFGLVLRLEQIGLAFGVYAFITVMEYDLNCPPSTPFFDWPLKSIYILSDTNDIPNLVNDCPCLEE